jgi:hypothetical protein
VVQSPERAAVQPDERTAGDSATPEANSATRRPEPAPLSAYGARGPVAPSATNEPASPDRRPESDDVDRATESAKESETDRVETAGRDETPDRVETADRDETVDREERERPAMPAGNVARLDSPDVAPRSSVLWGDTGER